MKKTGAKKVKVAAKKVQARKPAPKKVPIKKVAAKKPVVKKAPAKKVVPKKAAIKKSIEKKAAPSKPLIKKPEAVNASVRKETKKPEVKNIPMKDADRKTEAKAPGKGRAPAKSNLSKAQKKHFYDLLMLVRSEFMEQVKFHADEALTSQKDSAGERAGMATHMADLGSDNFRHDFELGLMSDEVDVVEMIEEALQRIEDNEFGVCLDCGCEISFERLDVKPYARYCIRCKSRREQFEDPNHRSR